MFGRARAYEPPVGGTPVRIEAVPAPPAQTQTNLAANAAWLLGSNIAYAACQWGAVIALAKFSHPEALGYFGLALAVTNPIVLVTGFALKAYQSTDVRGRYTFADYMNLRLGANIVAAVMVGAIIAVGVVTGMAGAVLVPVAVAKLADATSETCYGVAQKHERMRFVAIAKTVRGALGLLGLAAVIVFGGSVVGGAWALAAAWSGFLLLVELPYAGLLESPFGLPRANVLWRLARETAPLGGVAGVVALTQSLPRYLLQLTEGAAAVGYYTALASVVPVVSHLAAAVGNASAPRLGWAVLSDTRRYRGLVRQLTAIAAVASIILALGAALFGGEFLRIAYTPDYAAYERTLVLVVVAAGFGVVNTITYFALVAVRRVGFLLAIYLAGMVATGVVGVVLIPRFGLDGAAIGAVIGAAVTALLGARAALSGGGTR